jgi:hypothetical protein
MQENLTGLIISCVGTTFYNTSLKGRKDEEEDVSRQMITRKIEDTAN